MNKLIIPLIIILAAIMRLIPHPPNFTPIIAMGLFSGFCIKNKTIAILLPIMAMFFSDLFLGFHLTIYWVYGSLVIATILGMLLIKGINMKRMVVNKLKLKFVYFFVYNK